MARLRTVLFVPFFATLLVLCYIGGSYNPNKNAEKNSHFYDRADKALLAHRANGGRIRGLAYRGSPTGTATAPAPTESCYDPPSALPASQVDTDELCKCSSYAQYDERYNTYHNVEHYGGLASCWSTVVPRYSNETLVVDANESFTQCIYACDGSFEKKAKRDAPSADHYWFCHGVNFIQGSLCQFVGEIAYTSFSTPGVESYDNGLSPHGG